MQPLLRTLPWVAVAVLSISALARLDLHTLTHKPLVVPALLLIALGLYRSAKAKATHSS